LLIALRVVMFKTDLNSIMDEIASTHGERIAKSKKIARAHLELCYEILGLYQPKDKDQKTKTPQKDGVL
jgi:hypothetical protein